MEFSFSVPRQNEILGQFATKWYDFVNHFQNYQDQNRFSNSSLLQYFGAEALKEFQASNKISAEEFSRFSTCLESLEVHYLFQIVLCFIRHLFFTHCRRVGSTVEEFYTELKLLSDLCSFDDGMNDSIIKNQLIGNVQDKSARDVLVSANNLTAKNVVDVCSSAEKQGSIVNASILDMYIMNQQQKSILNVDPKIKKNPSWSSLQSLQEAPAEIALGLNVGTLLKTGSQCTNGTKRSAVLHSSGKQFSYLDLNYPPLADPDPLSSCISNIGVENSFPQNDDDATNVHTQYSPTVNCSMSFSADNNQVDSSAQQMKALENPNLKESFPIQTMDHDTNDESSTSSNNHISNNLSNDENNDDLLMSMLESNADTDTKEEEEEKDEELTVSFAAPQSDVIEVPLVFISQQKAILKTSQMFQGTGQAVDIYSCNFCTFSCAGKSAIEEHAMQVHKSLKCFVCTSCNAKFSSKEQLESHIRVKHLNVEEHKCQICDMIFSNQNTLFVHLQGHVEPRTVSCRVCKAMYPTKKLLSEHMSKMHPNTDKWVCRLCGETFNLRRLLSDHVSEVHKDRDINIEQVKIRKFTCRPCDITFEDRKSCEMHKRKFHRKACTKKYPCIHCDHICSSNANLISHMRIHTGEKPYMCEVCGKEFSQSSSLDKHTRIHTGEKPYKCQYCELSFNTSSNRLMHERNHRKEKPYVCEKCGKKFRNSYELKVHIDTHNEFRTKSFVCHCGAAFDTKGKLKRHEVCHTGQKPYRCEICGAGFTRSENVKGHQKSQACRNRVLKLH